MTVMADVSVKGSRWGALTLMVTGPLIVLASLGTWRVCSTTPCGGPLQAISIYSGLDLGFGVVTAAAGVVLTIVGAHAFRHNCTSRFATAAALAALVAAFAASASLAWMRFGGSGVLGVGRTEEGWLSPTAIAVAVLGLIALAAALRVRSALPAQ
jgi:hypothetical protein